MKKIANQHGDVVLEIVNSIPQGAKRIAIYEGFIVEKGEGVHTHILRKKVPCCIVEEKSPLQLKDISNDVEVWSLNDEMFIKVQKGCEVILDHEEHGQQILKEGIYRKVIEREFDYEKEIERRVID